MTMPPLNKRSLLVTTGDADGIGFEVAAKALVKLPKSFFHACSVFLFVTKAHEKRYFSLLKSNFSIETLYISSADFSTRAAVENSRSKSNSTKPKLFLVVASDSPPDWIYNLAKVCLSSPDQSALVTGPLSKTLIKSAGYSAIGHTEILESVSKASPLYMGFVGKYFNVILLTGHIPLKNVSKAIRKIDWTKTFDIVTDFVCGLKVSKRNIGLVGLNPHAGEKGLISGGEDEYLKSSIDQLNTRSTKIKIEGPLVPDAAFLKANWSRFSVYLCPYHDQALIPFKAIHGQDSGVHVTLGLPFVRTSVDHGTAKEIFGKNLANPNSMKEALVLAQQLLAKKVKSS